MADSAARADFLAAGGTLLAEASAAHLLGRAITIDALCRRAGRSPGGFYHHWPSIEAYVRDLILGSIDDANAVLADQLFGELRDLPVGADAPMIFGRMRSFFAAYLETVLVTPLGATAELLVWIVDDAELRAEVNDRYVELITASLALIPAALDAWGRELRPPWTAADLVRGLSAVLWGAQILDRLDPSPRYREIAVDMAMSTAALATRQLRSDLDGDDFLRLSLGVGRDGPDSAWAEHLRQRTAPIIADLHRRKGWVGVTLSAVAQAADEYIQDIDVVWSGRSGMAAAVWALDIVPALRAALDEDLAAVAAAASTGPKPEPDAGPSLSADEVLARHLERLVLAVHHDVALAVAFLSLSLGGAHAASTSPTQVHDLTLLVDVMADAIRAGAGAEVVASRTGADPVDVDPIEALAATVTLMVVTEASSRPDDHPATITDHLMDLLGPALVRRVGSVHHR